MKADRLLDAIGGIEDCYIVSAQRRLEAQGRHRKNGADGASGRGRYPRALLTVAAVFLVLLSSFTVAMAASEEFRSAVFRFFHISRPIMVPNAEEDARRHEVIEIAGGMLVENAVQVEYIRVKGSYGHTTAGGAVYVRDEDKGGAVSAYTIKDGKLRELPENREAFAYVWKGITYQVSFAWYDNEGTVSAGAEYFDPDTSAGWSVQSVRGNSEYVTVMLSHGAQTEYSVYPLLYHLRTHEVADVLRDCEEVRKQNIIEAEFSPDLSGILVTCGENVMWYDEYGSTVYYYNREKKDWQALSGLCEMNVMGAWFIDEDTIGCIRYDQEFRYTLKTLTISDGKIFQGFSDMPGSDWSQDGRGITFNGSRYGLLITEEGSVCVYDFKTGERTLVEGLEYSDDFSAGSFNPEGTKLLFSETNGGENVWVARIGILDLEKKTFISFEREGGGAPREYSIGWFDEERVGIEANTEESWYLYLFRAEAPEG